MIKKLRIKFTALSMISVIAVLAVILGIINAINYRNVVSETDQVLKMLSGNQGRFPEAPPEPDRRQDHGKDPDRGRKHSGSPEMSPELPYELRYFSVLLDEEGTKLETDIGKIAAVDVTTAEEYARDAVNAFGQSGFMGDYRYRKQAEGDNVRVIFLDCRRMLNVFRTFLIVSIAVSLAGVAAVFLLVFLLSGKAVRPFAESYEKQKHFITDAGHEIKTPLTIIDADAAVLELECGENEWLSDIQKQTERLKDLTADLIYLSKMEESQNKLTRFEFPVSEVVEQIIESFEMLAKAQNKKLKYQIEPELSYYGDEQGIRRLFSVLLDNAVKYSEEEGEISFTLRRQGKNICLTVFNTAEYIDKKDVSRLFDRFYRADQSRNSRTGGHGIGLSIAKAVVEAHGGKITAETEDEKSLQITALL